MDIRAVHLVYTAGMFPAKEKWVPFVGWQYTPAIKEETLCVSCLRKAWHLTAMENDQDIVLAARHQTKVTHLCERIDLLELDMIDYDEGPCKMCGNLLQGE